MLNRVRVIGLTALATLALLLVTAAPANAVRYYTVWHDHYYNETFGSLAKCWARGYGVIGWRNHDQRIKYARDFACYRDRGDKKWSMDIKFRFPSTTRSW